MQHDDQAPARLIGEFARDENGMPSMAPRDDDGRVPVNNKLAYGHAIIISVTNECSVMCTHCAAHSGGKLRGDNSAERIEMILREAADVESVKVVLFTGGEPFEAYELLKNGAALAKKLGFETGVVTSGNFAETDEITREKINGLQDCIDTFYVSIDKYHQRKLPIEYPRRAAKILKESGLKVIITNAVNADELEEDWQAASEAWLVASELNIPIHAWPLLAHGRGANLQNRGDVPVLRADTPCGLASKPFWYPGGDIHACNAGAGIFERGHPLHLGDCSEKSVEQILEGGNGNLLIQGLRAFGPVQLLKFLEQDEAHYHSQCHACHSLTALPDLQNRLRNALNEKPELLNEITEFRQACNDKQPNAHQRQLPREVSKA